jgi:glycosylphosphatidylinositol transamidase (GPIT) subunit GPI8
MPHAPPHVTHAHAHIGHGSAGMLKFQDALELASDELQQGLAAMHAQQR